MNEKMPVSGTILIINLLSLFNALINYLTIMILARAFGAGKEMDTYFAAISLPQIFNSILGVTITNTFVPMFIKARLNGEKSAWAFANSFINLSIGAFAFLAFLGFCFSKNIVSLFYPGLHSDAIFLTSYLFRYFLLSLSFWAISIVFTSIYYAHQKYLKPTISQTLNSALILLIVFYLKNSFGIKGIGVATIAGAMAQFLFLLPIILKKGRYRLKDGLANPDLKKFITLASPLFISTFFYKSYYLVERYLASTLGEGSISYLGYAGKIINFLLLFLAQGFSIVLFPKMSEQAVSSDMLNLKLLVSKSIRALIFLSLPLVSLIFIARYDIIKIIYERGRFLERDTKIVGDALSAYLGYFLAGLLSPAILNALYSLQETFKISMVSILGYLFYIVLAVFLIKPFSLNGIPIALSVQYLINLIVLSLFLKRRVGNYSDHKISYCLIRSIIASLTMMAIISKVNKIELIAGSPFFSIIAIFSVGLLIYFLVMYLLKAEEINLVLTQMAMIKWLSGKKGIGKR